MKSSKAQRQSVRERSTTAASSSALQRGARLKTTTPEWSAAASARSWATSPWPCSRSGGVGDCTVAVCGCFCCFGAERAEVEATTPWRAAETEAGAYRSHRTSPKLSRACAALVSRGSRQLSPFAVDLLFSRRLVRTGCRRVAAVDGRVEAALEAFDARLETPHPSAERGDHLSERANLLRVVLLAIEPHGHQLVGEALERRLPAARLHRTAAPNSCLLRRRRLCLPLCPRCRWSKSAESRHPVTAASCWCGGGGAWGRNRRAWGQIFDMIEFQWQEVWLSSQILSCQVILMNRWRWFRILKLPRYTVCIYFM